MKQMENLYSIIGERIKKQRIEKNFNQSDLADIVAINRTSISNIEKGRHQPPLHLIYRIGKALEVDIESLLPTLNELNDESSVFNILQNTRSISDKARTEIKNLFNKLD
jgi:DNA-binding XRE family transcriptional regulator